MDKFDYMKEWKARPAFTIEQLVTIYEESGRSTNFSELQAKARELYPDNDAPLYFCQGGFAGFDRGDGIHEKPAYTLGSHMCRNIAVLKDGRTEPY